MTAQSSQTPTPAGITPASLTPQTTDTIAVGNFGAYGCVARIVTTGTATNFSVLDPTVTALGNPGTVTAVACPATGVRKVLIPLSAVNGTTGNATVTFSSVTGVTYELDRY